ncbi:carboxypeptidase regulatory-like domain-containing protein [bacterium]|nr:carboxypeptidase regulatory-like domain-containing protein [bacterium]
MGRVSLLRVVLCCVISVFTGASLLAESDGIRKVPNSAGRGSGGMDAFAQGAELRRQLQANEKPGGKVDLETLLQYQKVCRDMIAAFANNAGNFEDGRGRAYRQKLQSHNSYVNRLVTANSAELDARMKAHRSGGGTHVGGDPPSGDPATSGGTDPVQPRASQAVIAKWAAALTASKPACGSVARRIQGQRTVELPAGVTADSLPSAQFTVTVHGRVYDSKHRPIGGVTIALSGENVQTTTKPDGAYALPFTVAGKRPPTGKPEARHELNLFMTQIYAVVPQELAFTPGMRQVSVFSIENRTDDRDITIQGLRAVGAPVGSIALAVRGSHQAVTGSRGTRSVIGPGGFVNVQVTWNCPVGAADAGIEVTPEDASLGVKTVRLRVGPTAEKKLLSNIRKELAVVQAMQDEARAEGRSGSDSPPPQPTSGSKDFDDLDETLKRIEAILLKKIAENLPVVKPAPKPGVPETINTAKAGNVIIINGNNNHVTVVGADSNVTFSPPPDALGPQGAQSFIQNQQKAGAKPIIPVKIDKGAVLSARVDKQDPIRVNMDELIGHFSAGEMEGRDMGAGFVNKLKKYAGTAIGTVEGVGSEAVGTVYNFFTEYCSVTSLFTKYEVIHDPGSKATTVTVFEDSVEVQSFTGDRSVRTLHAGQRVTVGPEGFGKLEELRTDALAAAAEAYAPAFLGLNPVSYEMVGIAEAVQAAEGKRPEEPWVTGMLSPEMTAIVWAIGGFIVLMFLGRMVLGKKKS